MLAAFNGLVILSDFEARFAAALYHERLMELSSGIFLGVGDAFVSHGVFYACRPISTPRRLSSLAEVQPEHPDTGA